MREANKEITDTIEVDKGLNPYSGANNTKQDSNVNFDTPDATKEALIRYRSSVPFTSLGKPCTKPPKRL